MKKLRALILVAGTAPKPVGSGGTCGLARAQSSVPGHLRIPPLVGYVGFFISRLRDGRQFISSPFIHCT